MKKSTIIRAVVTGIITFIVTFTILTLTSCGNYQAVDTVMTYDTGIVKLANGEVVEGKVQSWRDYENSDQIQVTIGGKSYLVHSMNATLIAG